MPHLLIRLFLKHPHLFLSLELQSESVTAAVTLSVCMALGLAVQKTTVPVFTSMPISSCSPTGVNELLLVKFTAFLLL